MRQNETQVETIICADCGYVTPFCPCNPWGVNEGDTINTVEFGEVTVIQGVDSEHIAQVCIIETSEGRRIEI